MALPPVIVPHVYPCETGPKMFVELVSVFCPHSRHCGRYPPHTACYPPRSPGPPTPIMTPSSAVRDTRGALLVT